MDVRRFSDLNSLNKYVAGKLLEEFQHYPRSLHLLPTGNTYRGCYKELNQLIKADPSLDFKDLVLLNLDEYIEDWLPLDTNDTRSFAWYMQPLIKVLTSHGFSPQNHFFPHSFEPTTPLSAYQQLTAFNQWVKEVACASVFLGLGPKDSPHIAFCAPGYTRHFDKPWSEIGAFVASVDEATRQANESNYGMSDRSVPHWAVTISPGTLITLKPERVYLVAYGDNKDLSVVNSSQDVSENPASILRILENQGSSVEIVTLTP